MAMRRGSKIVLAVLLAQALVLLGFFIADQFGPSIGVAKSLPDKMTREELEKLLGPVSSVDEHKYEKQKLSWDLKDGVVNLQLDRRHGQVIVDEVDVQPGAGTPTSSASLADVAKVPRAATREEAEQVLGKPTRESEWDQYTLRRLGWEYKDGFVFVSLNRHGKSMDVKASPVSKWARFSWRIKTAIRKFLN